MASTKEIFEQKIPEKLQKNADQIAAINAAYEFKIGEETWSIDLREGKSEVINGSTGAAGATITMSVEDFAELIAGNLNPQMAFMTGKLKVAGDMGLALKLGNILG